MKNFYLPFHNRMYPSELPVVKIVPVMFHDNRQTYQISDFTYQESIYSVVTK